MTREGAGDLERPAGNLYLSFHPPARFAVVENRGRDHGRTALGLLDDTQVLHGTGARDIALDCENASAVIAQNPVELKLCARLYRELAVVENRVADRQRATISALDGFVMITIAGLVVVHIIPHAMESAGLWALVIALVGFFAPGIVEHSLARAARQAHMATVVLAILLGRVFCGFICPFGAIHHAVGWCKPAIKGDRMVKANQKSPGLKIKYFMLITLLIAAVVGLNLTGLMDPIAFLFRSVALAILPGLGLGLRSVFDALAVSDIKLINLMSYGAEIHQSVALYDEVSVAGQ